MDANMRIGHFTTTQHLRLRVKMAGLKIILATGLLAFAATYSFATGLPAFDANLERWAKERLAKRIGEMRDSIGPSEPMRMVTEIDVKRGPLPLSAERNRDPVWVMATLRFGPEINVAPLFEVPVAVAETAPDAAPYPARNAYVSALVMANN